MLLLAHITILHLLVVHINITLVLANAPPATTTTLSDDINPHIVLLLYNVLQNYSTYHYEPTVNLTQQPTPPIHNTSSREPKL